MQPGCDPDASISGILVMHKISPLIALPCFVFAGFILVFKSSKHHRPSKNAYLLFIISKFACLLCLSAGMAPIIDTPSWGFQLTGFFQILDALNPMWGIILTVYCNLIMLFFLVQVINTRCEAIQKLSAVVYQKEKRMFVLLKPLLKVIYFFILFSFWCLLVTRGFAEDDVQRRLQEAAEKKTINYIKCLQFFFFIDPHSWVLIMSIILITFLLITFFIYSIGYLSATYYILKQSQMNISKKLWRIQRGFLTLLVIQVSLLFCVLLFLPTVFLSFKAPESEPTSLKVLLFIAHHGTMSTIIFILAHRLVRSRILKVYSYCIPKQHRIGMIPDFDRLPTHSLAQIKVFTVITENSTV